MSSYSALASVDRTFKVIEVLIGEVNGLSVTEIVHKTGLDKSAVSRILITLKDAGYVEVDDRTRLNRLSFKFLSLTYKHIREMGIEDIFYPFLEKLSERTGELIQLAVVTENGLFFIAKVEGKNTLKVASMLGEHAAYHATAVGKMALANLPNSKVIRVLGGEQLPKYTENTITDIETLFEELEKIRREDYAIANEEINKDIIAVGLPIYSNDEPRRLLAAIAIAAPNFKMDRDRINEIVSIFHEELENFDVSLLKTFSLGISSD
ncbi:IclR family transcriptional regulator [Bacillus canaveralius]|uniref:IclR family transcriptional regulator n=1 Tax=Bacillus canaveralius TaxID=1403243 RepID=UPI00163A2CFA|nr:IclR family transcriptional regulator [Bacillus canaveralius]